MRISRRELLLLTAGAAAPLLAGVAGGCRRQAAGGAGSPAGTVTDAGGAGGGVRFVDVTDQAGIRFVQHNGARGKRYFPETVGSGCAFLDYDNDGWQDLLILDGTDWPENRTPASGRNTPRLYHNNRDGTFTDITHEAGLDIEMYGMGVAVGDFDNDGYVDLFLTAIGPNRLFRNTLGDPTRRPGQPVFEDVTEKAGLAGVPMPGEELRWKWSTGAAWLDYDKDGRLDLFVCQYVQWSPEHNSNCGHDGKRGYCPPDTYEPTYCTLYHNEGDGTFKDVSEETGIRASGCRGKSLGVLVGDFDDDGWPDILVTNDTWPNLLFVNQQGKGFVERGVESGVAYGADGKARSGMGVDAADWRNQGRFDIAVGNFSNESLSLYQNAGGDLFTDVSHPTGLGAASLLFLTFGLFFFDYDLDGWQDLFTANGHIDDLVNTYNSRVTFRERPLLFHNDRGKRFVETAEACGLTQRLVGRGTACGDFDNDGDLDIAVVDNGGRFRLFRNDRGNGNRWIRFRTQGIQSNRDGIGARVTVTAGGVTQQQYVRSGGSYLSECQRELTFGLGDADAADAVEVVWPSGTVEKVGRLTAGCQYLLTEGKGAMPDPRVAPPARNDERKPV